jgi:hypothetical protein
MVQNLLETATGRGGAWTSQEKIRTHVPIFLSLVIRLANYVRHEDFLPDSLIEIKATYLAISLGLEGISASAQTPIIHSLR